MKQVKRLNIFGRIFAMRTLGAAIMLFALTMLVGGKMVHVLSHTCSHTPQDQPASHNPASCDVCHFDFLLSTEAHDFVYEVATPTYCLSLLAPEVHDTSVSLIIASSGLDPPSFTI